MEPSSIPEALTFDDILLIPNESRVLPTHVDVASYLTKDLTLHIPIVSAAMDSVTESQMAIALAQAGGIGIIHRNLTPEEQAFEVEKVKKSESGMILDPVTLHPDQKLAEAVTIMQEKSISGLPVVKNKILVGILTHRDIRFEKNLGRKISQIMTKKVVTVKEGINIDKAKEMLHTHRIEKLPVVNNKGELKGLITIKDIEKSSLYPFSTKDSLGRLRVGAAVGVGDNGLHRAAALIAAGVDVIIVDTAHGHSHEVLETVKKVRKAYPKMNIVGGNIATAEAARALIQAGVDAVKVGVGPGSICTTRIISGVGVPQIAAIMDCVKVAKDAQVCVIADGGIKFSGDITKAISFGADSVMIGSLLAGTDEAPGEVILYQGRSYKVYRGMGSLGAMSQGSKDRYFQGSIRDSSKLVPEGIEGIVPYRGLVADSLHQLVGGLKAGMGYLGAKDLKELRRKARFVRITNAGYQESHVHDVMITKGAPNYRKE
ncbi:MAG: IMP dehydrogenase [Deltaproteobacteria bacterium RIFCSPLOWO2_02_FULL_50_16]|nr:MAG: IMP dehydrogenase [Deltaproteobacteria bacterium RIFCSPHIGHO2_02_FULL_50_15]OGQ56916.1 MAG: IMP dehydrogenase [Deltaproteobacteria bacterium RIFCSPLOWO2_02_FULL_50_16]OGQ67906.1 MAG: IMP dehydrogenase [Deltaproteobacteria bacterium RIFCSPLOWO2_12_FULL_50_11]